MVLNILCFLYSIDALVAMCLHNIPVLNFYFLPKLVIDYMLFQSLHDDTIDDMAHAVRLRLDGTRKSVNQSFVGGAGSYSMRES